MLANLTFFGKKVEISGSEKFFPKNDHLRSIYLMMAIPV
jgi:hypothetical protein